MLIRPNHAPPWLQTELIGVLSTLPLRPDGVRGTLEFVFAVHPTSTVKNSEAATPQKQGANITHEALKLATAMLATPPKRVRPEAWYSGIAPQLLKLLDGDDGPEMTKVASYVIGFGILGRKDFGAPGTPGWKAFAGPMLRQVNPSISASPGPGGEDEDDIVDLRQDKVLVSSEQLALGLRRLKTLVVTHPNPSLCKRLVRPVLLSLWSLASWPQLDARAREDFSHPALELLKIYLKLGVPADIYDFFIQHLTYTGPGETTKPPWQFKLGADGMLHIVTPRSILGSGQQHSLINVAEVDARLNVFMDLLEATASEVDISTIFLDLFRKWLESTQNPKTGQILIKEEDEPREDAVKKIVELKLLQIMMEKWPEKVISRSDHALELVSQVLDNPEVTHGEEEGTAVALSILNLVITAPRFRKANLNPEVLRRLEVSLDKLSKLPESDVVGTARNLSLLLKYRDEVDDEAELSAPPTDRQVEDRKTYNLAVSYIVQVDSPPPVRMEGLNLLSGLVQSHSPVLDIPAILVIMSSLLTSDEDYINLKVIKIYTLLANAHPKSVVRELLDHYVDPQEKATVDTRLRFGEALTQVVDRLGQTFAGDLAQDVCNALLSTAGRRGYRPRTERRQAKDAAAAARKKKEDDEVWGGEAPDIDALKDEIEGVSEEERARNEIIARIVSGWESKRGTEDIRIRASALSIFAVGMETNIVGIRSEAISNSVDLAVNILTLESEEEKGILRRSAVLLILDFVKALEKARQEKRKLGFGLTGQSREDILRVLEYVAGTDNDGLVRQHAGDVVESLRNYEMISALPDLSKEEQTPLMGRLAGLAINPVLDISPDLGGPNPGKRHELGTMGGRPRIEEIE